MGIDAEEADTQQVCQLFIIYSLFFAHQLENAAVLTGIWHHHLAAYFSHLRAKGAFAAKKLVISHS